MSARRDRRRKRQTAGEAGEAITTLYITGAGVNADSSIPTFRGHDGYWTIDSRNYTPQEMATRAMYLGHPAQFLLWYYRRFAAYRYVQPNAVHR